MREPPVPTKQAKMVGWYNADVLAQSAWMMTVANLFGRHSDSRLIEALSNQPQGVFRFEADASDGEFWFDFVSDVGDGFNPTYTVARGIAAAELDVEGTDGAVVHTRAGSVLVFGGDQVYPYPTRGAYEERTEAPYAAAFAAAGRTPKVFAVPGNHDWFDSLIAFSRLFCRPERGFAGCATGQTRSYFALQLPGDWWLCAVDLQFGSEMDEPQERYFRDVSARMPPEANIILCVPSPQWIYAESYPAFAGYSDDSLRDLEERVLGRKIAVFLTGDLHHYKRHESVDGQQKIVSGGGGAFLHPTHVPEGDTLRTGHKLRATFPDADTSRRLTWRNLLFPWLNPGFLGLVGIFYLLSAWFASATFGPEDLTSLPAALLAALEGALREPVNGLWLLMFVAAIIFFTDTHSKWYRLIGGFAHACAHLAAAFFSGWLSLWFTTQVLGLTFGSLPQMALAGLITFTVGAFAGALVMGGYLFLSLRFFGRHANEAFSSLRVQDYKQWLRLRIDAAGALTIHAIGIDRVARRWRGPVERPEPDDPRATAPRLIDRVILRPLGQGRYGVGHTQTDHPKRAAR